MEQLLSWMKCGHLILKAGRFPRYPPSLPAVNGAPCAQGRWLSRSDFVHWHISDIRAVSHELVSIEQKRTSRSMTSAIPRASDCTGRASDVDGIAAADEIAATELRSWFR